MKKIKFKIVIFASSISLLLSNITLCQFQSKQLKKDIKEHTYVCEDNDIDIIAHRGFSSLALDNSKEAIDMCKNYHCVDGIEIDIRLTADNKIVLSHNKNITTTDNEKLDISETKYSKLKEKKLKNNTFKRDLLSIKHLFNPYTGALALERKNIRNESQAYLIELEELLNDYDNSKELIIDIKYNEDEVKFNMAIKQLLQDKSDLNITLQSFEIDSLLKLKKELPQFQYQMIISDPIDMEEIKNYPIKRIGIKHNSVKYNQIASLINQGYHISIWTVNSYPTFQKVTDELEEYYDDVSYISNYPDCICYWVKQKKK